MSDLKEVATLNLVRWPARVCFWTGMIFSTSSFREEPRKKSMISDSCNSHGLTEDPALCTNTAQLVKLLQVTFNRTIRVCFKH